MPSLNQTSGGLFVGEQLMAQARRIYEEQMPPNSADILIPPSGGDLKGAAQYAREVYQHQGQADWVGDGADDLPMVNASVIRDVYNIDQGGCAYGWSLKEINAAAFANKPLEQRRGISARRAIENFRNAIFFTGSLAKQIYGLFSFPLIPRTQLSLADFQPGADPEDTLAAMLGLEADVIANTEGAAEPTHLVVGIAVYNFISTTRANLLNNDTILEVYKRNAQSAKTVVRARELDTAGPTGGQVIACIRVAPDIAEHIVPNPLEVLAPQDRNLRTIVNVVCDVGGFVTEYPLNHAIGELS